MSDHSESHELRETVLEYLNGHYGLSTQERRSLAAEVENAQEPIILYAASYASAGCLPDSDPVYFATLEEAEEYAKHEEEEYEEESEHNLYSWDVHEVYASDIL